MTTDPCADSFEAFLAEQLADPRVRAAYEDANAKFRLLDALVTARKAAGLTRNDVADRVAEEWRSKRRRMRRMVDQYEGGLLMHDAPLWFVYAYARAVGARLSVRVEEEDNT